MNTYIIVILALGGFSALLLTLRPRWLLWVSTIYTLIFVGLLGYFFPATKIFGWVAYGATALMYIYALTVRRKILFEENNEVLLKVSLFSFILISFLSIAYSLSPIYQVAAAAKSLFMFGGLWVLFACVSISEKEMVSWLKLVIAIGLVQWLPTIYQYLFVRSYRLESGLGTVSSADSVVGTFGGSMEAGGLTAVLAFFLVMLIVGLTALKTEGVLKLKKYSLALVFLVVPLLIMEVKVIFFYLPVAMAVLFRKEIFSSPVKALVGSGLMVVFLSVLLVAYQYFHWSAGDGDISDNFEKSFSYSFQSEGGYLSEQSGALTRRGALEFWVQEHSGKSYVEAAIGHGLGSSRTNGQVLGVAAQAYNAKNIDQTGLALMLWDVGILGVIAFIGILLAIFRRTNYLIKKLHDGSWQKALARALNAIIPLFGMALLYRSDIPYAAPMMFLVFSVFGLSAWLRRNVHSSKDAPLTGKGKSPEVNM